ncbi:MAG: NADP-dependent oxidoreductase [Acidimicrobiales bacterium]
MSASNVQILLRQRPVGFPGDECFELVERRRPEPGPGDVLVRNIYLSTDPYLRGRMDGAFALGEPIVARVVGQVEQSQHSAWRPGDLVWGFLGWEQYTLVRGGGGLTRIDPALGPISHAISVLGMPGLTAWVGMIQLGRPEPGETVFVSSAAGAVGSVAGQLARLAGARVVGSAGSDAKCAHVVDTLRFDACFNYRTAASINDALKEHCPAGIDVYFDNVGGETLEAVFRRMNDHARIPVCGMIARYNDVGDSPGTKGLIAVLAKRATMTGFSIYDHVHQLPAFLPRMSAWLRSGEVVYTEEIIAGVERAPEVFQGMLRGDGVGKRLVQVSEDPTKG